ncbi:helix-turn-helix domain-containing protein [Thalassospira tepidiphila]|uniref:AraC family transcriptional regulator n=2 Tax=Thalassospira tepidiphila TaxID=393657 RepID=A0A853KY75_9PROT|nr:helix-turn-helix domain-containing protein [Thalassospira tepidiphila]NJB75945.1 AraC-like DNA-binding protein [Thalassospira tepidiphila]OAZ08755.1 AraC family transcriptional regulator [Thalassospira tepidiphila MCCC 1A03514]
MTGWTHYVSVVVAAVGVVQAVFLCLILRSEGSRAFGANRWMMLFIAGVALNLIEDVADPLVSADFNGFFELLFKPINFAIGPAIYLYFREISGNPSRLPWGHFVLLLVVFNLTAWVVIHGGGGAVLGSGAYTTGELVEAFCWVAIFVQIAIYLVLLWRIAWRYQRQAEEQLGADRKVMQRWICVVLGGLTFVFITVAVGKIVGLYLPENPELFGSEIALVLVLFAMSYEIATQPALFVMPDWPSDDMSDDVDEADELQSERAPSTGGNLPQKAPVVDDGAPDAVAPRPLLDPDGVDRALARLKDIQARGDILLDPLVSLPKLARAVGITPNQLSYVLNHHVGKSFFDFVNSARIREARSVLVLEPDRTILDIALSVGFNSKSTFNLAFKKITGETPSAVREAARREVLSASVTSEPPIAGPDQQHWTPNIG